jgi:hypothetical protein
MSVHASGGDHFRLVLGHFIPAFEYGKCTQTRNAELIRTLGVILSLVVDLSRQLRRL